MDINQNSRSMNSLYNFRSNSQHPTNLNLQNNLHSHFIHINFLYTNHHPLIPYMNEGSSTNTSSRQSNEKEYDNVMMC